MKLERFGFGIVKGMSVTLRHLFKHPTVSQYPEQRLHLSKRTRGNELVWDDIRCTGCGTCAKTCPQGVIEIVTSVMPVENKYKVEKFQVDTGYCIACGLCVEACPYAALFMGFSVERAKYRREELVQKLDELLVSPGRPKSAYFHPENEKDLPRQTLLLEKITEKE